MPQLWVQLGEEWGFMALGRERLVVTSDPYQPIRADSSDLINEDRAVLQRVPGPGEDWVLLGLPGACRVNGDPVDFGIRALKDRDEIQAGFGARIYFSTETQAGIAPFSPGKEGGLETTCPRCLQAIRKGQPAVVCPTCSTAFHQDAGNALPCWTYGPCPVCGRPGSLVGDFSWSPEGL